MCLVGTSYSKFFRDVKVLDAALHEVFVANPSFDTM